MSFYGTRRTIGQERLACQVDGISTLLHLVCTSLEHYRTDDVSSSFLFDPSKMRDAAEHKPNSARKVSVDDNNKQLEIYPGRSERERTGTRT
jgi:hypothetical protein